MIIIIITMTVSLFKLSSSSSQYDNTVNDETYQFSHIIINQAAKILIIKKATNQLTIKNCVKHDKLIKFLLMIISNLNLIDCLE